MKLNQKKVHLSIGKGMKKKIRAINGMNGGPLINNGKNAPIYMDYFKSLRIPAVRHHDAPLENSGYALIDVSRIFPLFHADENDPANYIFDATDDYLLMMSQLGCEIQYRLGETIEHSARKYRVNPPKDPDKWARICLNIIRHYKSGWAKGFELPITSVSIWEEPTNPQLFAGDFLTEFCPLFAKTAKLLKKEYPSLIINGPNQVNCDWSNAEKMLQYLKEQEAPLDEYSWTSYTREPAILVEQTRIARNMLDRNGFTSTGLALTEWHLSPVIWTMDEKRVAYMQGVHSAAYTAQALTLLQDTPLAMAYYYMFKLGAYGLFKRSGVPTPAPVFYGFKAFSDMLPAEERLEVELEDELSGYSFLCGRMEDGSYQLLISCFKGCFGELMISPPAGKEKCLLASLQEGDEAMKEEDLSLHQDGTYHLTHDSGSAVYLLTFS